MIQCLPTHFCVQPTFYFLGIKEKTRTIEAERIKLFKSVGGTIFQRHIEQLALLIFKQHSGCKDATLDNFKVDSDLFKKEFDISLLTAVPTGFIEQIKGISSEINLLNSKINMKNQEISSLNEGLRLLEEEYKQIQKESEKVDKDYKEL
jgi:septal ring factor EnvC (AmiA/AmiB activator)